MTETPAPAADNGVAANGTRTYYRIMGTQMLSMIGSQMTSFALGIYLFLETGDVTPLGLVAFFAVGGRILATGLAGIIADRYDRRQVMVMADVGQALGTLALMLLFFAGVLALWHVYVVTLFSALAGAFQAPAFSAAVTQLVPEDQRDRANSFGQLTGAVSNIVAPVLAGALYALLSVGGIMVLDLLTFGVAIMVIFLSDIPRPQVSAEGLASQQEPLWQQLTFGIRWLWKARPLFYATLMATLANFFLMPVMVLNTPYILTLTDNNKALLGTIQAAFGVGGVVGALLIGSVAVKRQWRVPIILAVLTLEGAVLMLYGIVQAPVGWMLLGFITLASLAVVNTLFMSLVQLKTPADIQGRVMATIMQLAMLTQPLAVLLVGPLADAVFEPAVGGAGWELVAPFVGESAGSGMGLIIVLAGLLNGLAMLTMSANPQLRQLDDILPDYNASAAPAIAVTDTAEDAPPADDTPPQPAGATV